MLYTIGYGKWSTNMRISSLMQALTSANIDVLVDVRRSPCASNLSPESNYGPRDWHLQDGDQGIQSQLKKADIKYVWLVELGNPQIHDKQFRVLREHIESDDEKWPVNRGLKLLHKMMIDEKGNYCLLCTCKSYEECHRRIIAETLRGRYFSGDLEIQNI